MKSSVTKWAAVAFLMLGMALSMPGLTRAQDDLDGPPPTIPPTFIKPDVVLQMVNAKDPSFVLVDLQPEEAYAVSHVPGAINFAYEEKITPPIALPRDKTLIFYCPCQHDEDSIATINMLREFGYSDMKVLEGGWYKWVDLKYPVFGDPEGTAPPAASSSTAAPAPAAPAVDAAPAVVSGRQVGAVTPSFRVLDVTGKYKGTSTCYVCEYGDAPTVIGFFQNTGDDTASLIVKLNSLVASKSTLKGVAVVEAGPDAKEWLEKLAQDKGITIPLVVFQNGPKDVDMKVYKLNPDAKNTFIVADKRTISANLVNLSDGTFQQLADASAKMLSTAGAATTASNGSGN